jgi:hypothetical protein
MALKTANDGSNGSFKERYADMNWLKTFLKALLIAVTALQITACSKSVQWEEEVPLNTGETIWVKREAKFVLKGGGPLALDIAYQSNGDEKIDFDWKGKKYSYAGVEGIMLLAISPETQQPVLVARGDLKNWKGEHTYRCTTPFYVQFIPSEDGRQWSWPSKIEPWLYNLEYNLMYHRVEAMYSKYSTQARLENDHVVRHQSPSLVRVEPTFTFTDVCRFIK